MTFDDERAVRALDLLRDLARDFQVIYLTTSDRYDGAADAVVVLAGPTAVDEGILDAPEGEAGPHGDLPDADRVAGHPATSKAATPSRS